MTGRNLCILLLASLSFTVVLGKNSYFEHYFSKYHHHKSSSTTRSISSTLETTTSETIISYNQDAIASEEDSSKDDITSEEDSSSKDDITSDEDSSSKDIITDTTNFISNTTVLYGGGQYDDSSGRMFLSRVATIVGSVLFVVFIFGCLVCCCPKCRGAERRGFIVRNRAPEILPQPVITLPPPQPATVQHLPPEYIQETVQQFPPQYQQPMLPPTQYAPAPQTGYHYSPVQPQPPYSPVQQQIHYSPVHPGYQDSSMLQFYNPPEAPPPYEPTAPTK